MRAPAEAGYEPNALRPRTCAMAVVRGSSAPSGAGRAAEGIRVNPFWSERAQLEGHLRDLRPGDLPPVSREDSSVEAEISALPMSEGRGRPRSRSGGPRGKGTGGAVLRGEAGEDRPVGRERFQTPASWQATGPLQSAGLMPEPSPTGGGAEMRTQGPAPAQDELQRDLEREVVELLHRENQQLREEVVKLQQLREASEATSGWSEVMGTSGQPVEETQKENLEMKTPPRTTTRSEEVSKRRFTPGGTMVPPDTPPMESGSGFRELPPWPQWMGGYERVEMQGPCKATMGGESVGLRPQGADRGMESRYAVPDRGMNSRHEVCDRGMNSRHGEDDRRRSSHGFPDPEGGNGSLTAAEARAYWLEKEVSAMREALADMQKSNLKSAYWANVLNGAARNARSPQGDGDVLGCDRAGVHGIQGGDRAGSHGVHGGDRAGIHGVYGGDRASTHGLCEGDRASTHGLVGGDRASTHGLCAGDRASTQGRCGEAGTSMRESHHGDRLWHHQLDGRYGGDPDGRNERKGGRSPDGMRTTNLPLPKLPSLSSKTASVDMADWLIEIQPLIGDISNHATVWWSKTVEQTMDQYTRWLGASPLERLRLSPPRPKLDDLCGSTTLTQRLEQRVTTLLLPTLPEELKHDVVSNRTLWPAALLYRILRSYQPGGWTERSDLLNALASTTPGTSAATAATQLRMWKRQRMRALELGAALPDLMLQVQAIERIGSGVLSKHLQSVFRVSSFRMEVNLDERPTEATLLQFHELMLAEMDALSTGAMTVPGLSVEKPNVKMVQSPGKGNKVCGFWGTPDGCRYGRACKFSHDAPLVDKSLRCWICSSLHHRKADCPAKQIDEGKSGGSGGPSSLGTPSTGGQGKGVNGGHGKGGKAPGKHGKDKSGSGNPGGGRGSPAGDKDNSGKGTSTSEVKSEEAPKIAAVNQSETKDANESSSATVTGAPNTTGAAGETELLSEVTSLLRSLRSSGQGLEQRGPAVKVAYVKKLDPTENTSYLLDGGATHPLRQCKNRAEWNAATPTVVNLALGEAHLWQKENGTLLTEEQVQPIIPVQDLTMIGVKVTWVDGVCRMTLQGSKLGVYMDQGCPCVGAVEGKRLMEQVEEMHTRRAALRSVKHRPRDEDASEDERSLRFFFNLFPDVPQYIAEKVIGYADYDTSRLPWNRKVRRRIEEASCLILHLYSGKNKAKWKELEYDEHAEHGDTPSIVVLCVDVEHGGDLHNPHLMGYLENLARHGRLAMLIGGPPCRTVSAARLRDDGGPRAVRGRGKGTRWGLSRNTAYEQNLCNGDSALWLKMCWLAVLGKNGNPEMETLIEQPQDPEEWQAPFRPRPEFGFASYLTWPETWMTKEIASLSEVRFDQGTVGHDYCKPTTLLTDVKEMKQLDGQRVAQGMTQGWPGYLKDRMNEAKMAAEWAPGLCDLIKTAIRRKWGQSRWRTTPGSQRRGALPQMARGRARAAALGKGLKQDEKAEVAMWAAHYHAGHVPFRRDCEVCLEAAGRDRPRKAIPHPSAFTWSLDLMGPFVESHDQELPYARYGLVTVVTIPTKAELPVVRGLQELGARVPPSRKRPLPQWPEEEAIQDGRGNPGR